MIFSKYINEEISEFFPDSKRAHLILSDLNESKETERVIRCILVLSDRDYVKMASWVKKANEDYRNVIFFAEYDDQGNRINNYNNPIKEKIS